MRKNESIKKSKRYDTSGLLESQFEQGSRSRVLKNLLGIKSRREMERIEVEEQLRATGELSQIYHKNYKFTAADVCKIHKVWLGKVYEWAGQYRKVNISKENLSFAASRYVPQLMEDFEKDCLRKYTPCTFKSENEVIEALAIVHTELVLIHPFREGNGRSARLLASLMAMQAGLPPLNFGSIQGKKRQEYFAAVRAGFDKNYEPMKKIFSSVVQRSKRFYGV